MVRFANADKSVLARELNSITLNSASGEWVNKGDVLFNNFKKQQTLSIKSRLFSPGMTNDTKVTSPISTRDEIPSFRKHAATAKITKRKLP